MPVSTHLLTRRSLLSRTAATAAVAACGTALPGVPPAARRIGLLSTGAAAPADAPPFAAFREGMRTRGFIEERDYTIDYKFGVFDPDLLLRWARELALSVEVIVASTTGATQAARVATSEVPIVMVASHDPVDAGVVLSLTSPGGNVTGQSLAGGDLMPAQLDYLRQIRPLRRLGYLSPSLPSYGPNYPSVTDTFERRMRSAAGALGIEVVAPQIRAAGDVPAALATLGSEPIDALYMIESPTWFVSGASLPINEVVAFAIRRGLPLMGGHRMYAKAGVLATYGDVRSYADMHRSAATYVARILRGAVAKDIPVERSSGFELVVNATTAEAMALEVPRTLLALADVIR
jgi:putative tryptophan/tyrosine transport system substrate-binding protein